MTEQYILCSPAIYLYYTVQVECHETLNWSKMLRCLSCHVFWTPTWTRAVLVCHYLTRKSISSQGFCLNKTSAVQDIFQTPLSAYLNLQNPTQQLCSE